VFSERLNIRPWEIGLLSVDDFEALLDYIEDSPGD
jgi:hypothetical protein